MKAHSLSSTLWYKFYFHYPNCGNFGDVSCAADGGVAACSGEHLSFTGSDGNFL